MVTFRFSVSDKLFAASQTPKEKLCQKFSQDQTDKVPRVVKPEAENTAVAR
jgi:hypothetical protein